MELFTQLCDLQVVPDKSTILQWISLDFGAPASAERIIDCFLPASLTRQVLRSGLLHENIFVRYVCACALVSLFD